MSSPFGYITRKKIVHKPVEVVEHIKPWRVKLGEWLLGEEIQELEYMIREDRKKYLDDKEKDFAEREKKLNDEVAQRAVKIAEAAWEMYKMSLEEEILDELGYDFQLKVEAQPYDKKDLAYIETEMLTYEMDGITYKVPKRFIKKEKS